MLRRLICLTLLFAPPLMAQSIVDDQEILASDRPEAWAMNYVLASSVMTSFGATPELAAGEWNVGAEIGHIPRLSRRQQQIGFGGEKAEDLNKSPVFGRLRLMLGLPAGFVAELGYTPPVKIDGTSTDDLFALAFGRRLLQRDTWSLSARAFGQHGSAHGDITCPADIAGPFDEDSNPFGCVEASDDRIALNYYAVDLTAAGDVGLWQWHAGGGAVRSEPKVQVDARVFSVRDRSRLVARGMLPYLALGIGREIAPGWSLAGEILHVPLDVQREPAEGVENDPLTSVRLMLRYWPP